MRTPFFLSLALLASLASPASAEESFATHDEALAVRGMTDLNSILASQTPSQPCGAAEPPHWLFMPGQAATLCFQSKDPAPEAKSANLEYFRQLVQRGTSAPLSDFLKTWAPDSAQPAADSPFFGCEIRPMGNMKADSSGDLSADCQPDTLYAWVSKEKLATLRQQAPGGAVWDKALNRYKGEDKVFFTTISPASTFGYGDYLVRFTVKDGAPFRFRQYSAKSGEIGVANSDFHDYAFTDGTLLDGYSFGQPEIYDELVRDIRRFGSDQRVVAYSECFASRHETGIKRLYSQCVDNHPQDETKLKENLLNLLRQILAHEGDIVHPRGTCRARAEDFSTAKPSYVNGNGKDKGLALVPPPRDLAR